MGMTSAQVAALLTGEMELTPEIADKLEFIFGIPAKFWNKWEAGYRKKLEDNHE